MTTSVVDADDIDPDVGERRAADGPAPPGAMRTAADASRHIVILG